MKSYRVLPALKNEKPSVGIDRETLFQNLQGESRRRLEQSIHGGALLAAGTAPRSSLHPAGGDHP